MGVLQAGKGILNNGWVIAIMPNRGDRRRVARSFLDRAPDVGNRTLCISVGGGLATIMFLSVWGIVWRCQKRLIAWTRANAEQNAPMPPEAVKLARMSFLTARLNFWISFPMLFFMGASAHFPFLSGR